MQQEAKTRVLSLHKSTSKLRLAVFETFRLATRSSSRPGVATSTCVGVGADSALFSTPGAAPPVMQRQRKPLLRNTRLPVFGLEQDTQDIARNTRENQSLAFAKKKIMPNKL